MKPVDGRSNCTPDTTIPEHRILGAATELKIDHLDI